MVFWRKWKICWICSENSSFNFYNQTSMETCLYTSVEGDRHQSRACVAAAGYLLSAQRVETMSKSKASFVKGNKILLATTIQVTTTNRRIYFFFLDPTWQTDHTPFSGKQFLLSLGRSRVLMWSQAQHLRVPSTYFKMWNVFIIFS